MENAKKKLKKIKNTIMASFQAKIVWKRPRKRENKNYRLFRSFLTRYGKFQKNSNKIQKIKRKYRYGFISSQNRLKEDEKGRK